MSHKHIFGDGSVVPSNPEAGSYSNVYSYLGLPLSRATETLGGAVVMGVPYDLATSARAGARHGPMGIRQASAQLRWEQCRYPWDFKLAEKLAMVDYGDIDYSVGDSRNMSDHVIASARHITGQGNFLLSFGGDHYVSFPIIKGIFANAGQMALIHFDAHSDTEEIDLEFYHGSMFYHAIKDGLIDAKSSIQVGLRTEHNSADFGLSVLDAVWVNNHSAAEISQRIREVVGDKQVYLSIDIDCLDPAFAPGTGTPVVGGFSTDKLLQILRGLCGLHFLGADVMEVSPAYDHADLTTLAAATIGLDILHIYSTSRS